MRQHLECAELCLGVGDERGESLWIRTKDLAGKGDTGEGVRSRPPEQEEEVGENFYRQLETASQSQTLVLVGKFHYPDIHWRSTNSPGHYWKALMITS